MSESSDLWPLRVLCISKGVELVQTYPPPLPYKGRGTVKGGWAK